MSDIRTPALLLSTADTELIEEVLESLGEDVDTVYFDNVWDNTGFFRTARVQRIGNAFWVWFLGADELHECRCASEVVEKIFPRLTSATTEKGKTF